MSITRFPATGPGVIGLLQRTSNQTTFTSGAAITGLSGTFDVKLPGRVIRIMGKLRMEKTDTVSRWSSIELSETDGTNELTRSVCQYITSPANTLITQTPVAYTEPTVGEHTYLANVESTVTAQTSHAGATYPALLLVEDLGRA